MRTPLPYVYIIPDATVEPPKCAIVTKARFAIAFEWQWDPPRNVLIGTFSWRIPKLGSIRAGRSAGSKPSMHLVMMVSVSGAFFDIYAYQRAPATVARDITRIGACSQMCLAGSRSSSRQSFPFEIRGVVQRLGDHWLEIPYGCSTFTAGVISWLAEPSELGSLVDPLPADSGSSTNSFSLLRTSVLH